MFRFCLCSRFKARFICDWLDDKGLQWMWPIKTLFTPHRKTSAIISAIQSLWNFTAALLTDSLPTQWEASSNIRYLVHRHSTLSIRTLLVSEKIIVNCRRAATYKPNPSEYVENDLYRKLWMNCLCLFQDVIAICCAWCQIAYHNRDQCFQQEQLEEECTLGEFSPMIIPPSWIIKIPRKVSQVIPCIKPDLWW